MTVKYKGYEAMQTANYHVIILKDKLLVMHVPYGKKLAAKELRGEIERCIKMRESIPSITDASAGAPPPTVYVEGMVTRDPVDVLIALACCSSSKLSCDECPFQYKDPDKCNAWTDDEIVEAVRTLRGMIGNV